MKEYIAETGGRYTYSDDILNLQELALSMSAVFDGCLHYTCDQCLRLNISVMRFHRVNYG